MTALAKKLKPAEIEKIFATLAKANPHPVTELVAPNPFCLLVAIVLSAQATDVSVNKATKALFAKADTSEAILNLGLGKLKDHIKTIGLYNAKAKNIIALCQRLLSVYDGQIPETREALETLPGVGRKTANVWLNCVKGEPTIAVDTHVFRVANRLGLCNTTNPLSTELALEKAIPKNTCSTLTTGSSYTAAMYAKPGCRNVRNASCANGAAIRRRRACNTKEKSPLFRVGFLCFCDQSQSVWC